MQIMHAYPGKVNKKNSIKLKDDDNMQLFFGLLVYNII